MKMKRENEGEKITDKSKQVTYFFCIPGRVCWWVGDSVVDGGNHNSEDCDGGDEAPGGLPVKPWPHPYHLFYVIGELFVAIHI